MADSFCHPTKAVVASLAVLFKHQGKPEISTILESATARIEQTDYDNYDGGTDIFTLFLEVPLKVFAKIEPGLENFERTIEQKLRTTIRNTGNQALSNVSISPVLDVPTSVKPLPHPNEEDRHRLWDANCLKLFLSHVAAYKAAVTSLKQRLLLYGVSAFVAHEDIKPTKEWINEIELALSSSDALLALLTPEFHESKWTDQEVGIALGRSLLIISVHAGCDPYGFIGKNQALHGNLERIDQLAPGIVGVLLQHPTTSRQMHEALTIAFERADSFANAKTVSSVVITAKEFSVQQLARIEAACEDNDQIKESFGVPTRIRSYLDKIRDG